MKYRFITAFIFILGFWFLSFQKIYASTDQAYKDYLYHSDLYQKYNTEFQVAKNEYEKFHTLLSETSALEASKKMVLERDELLKAYLILLSEKVTETAFISDSERTLYQTLIQNEIEFLTKHALKVPAISSINDANTVSKELESHYTVFKKSIIQIQIGVSLGILRQLQEEYDTVFNSIKDLIDTNQLIIPARKQIIFDRWLLQISNKRLNSQEKFDLVSKNNTLLKVSDENQLDRDFKDLKQELINSKQYLHEGTAYMKELIEAIRYQD